MILPSVATIDRLRKLLDAWTLVLDAYAAVTAAHIALRNAGGDGCQELMDNMESTTKQARITFKTAYNAEQATLDDAGAAYLYRAVYEKFDL